MKLDQFATECDLASLSEVDKACYLAFYNLKTKNTEEFTAVDAARDLVAFGFSTPNQTRLNNNLKASRKTMQGRRGFKLRFEFVKDLETRFTSMVQKSQDVVDDGTIIPEVDYKDTRGYIVALAKQINISYEQNAFDGCTVLMRRLVEVLLILSYQHLNIETVIQDANRNYQMLEAIIGNAKNNTELKLSRTSKADLDLFRELGNFSAHRIEYICRREYITPHIQKYRALIVELLHKAGIRV